MRALLRFAVAASLAGGLVAAADLTAALAQGAAPPAQGEDAPPKQVPLTQKQIDGVLSAQSEIRAIEEKLPRDGGDKPDPKVEAKLDAVAKKNGFANIGEYSDVSSSIGIVMAGMDPETKKYVGPEAVIKKQIAAVQADKQMPPKEKKEALEELKSALSPSTSAQPLPDNVALVGKNFEKLSQSMQQDAD